MGLGFRHFTDLQILTAYNFTNYLADQCIIVCTTESDRDLALAPYTTQGMVCYVKEFEEMHVYDGSAWQKLASYDEATELYDPRDNLVFLAMQAPDIV